MRPVEPGQDRQVRLEDDTDPGFAPTSGEDLDDDAPWACGECGARWTEEMPHVALFALGLPRPRCPECGGTDTDDFNPPASGD